jgi:hypothetical protein
MGAYLSKQKNRILGISSSYRTQKPFSTFQIGWKDMGGSIT